MRSLRSSLACVGWLLVTLAVFSVANSSSAAEPVSFSGRYPHLTMFNSSGECGIGAVVPWANRLWVVTYAPHKPDGSDDKLYEINSDLKMVARPESVGGTPANRLIHRESQQLIIGPHFIDAKGNVRTIPPKKMPGRLTAVARHLTDPANKVYIYDMEGALYEVEVHTLAVKRLFEKPVPGWHGKGGYTAQGRLVLANNGEKSVHSFKKSPYLAGGEAKNQDEAGVLAEWDGADWKIVERKQFTEVTGPGGIQGNPDDEAPLWAVGWDKRSLILKLLNGGKWHTYRLPKGDFSYDARHGWYTEWPRIREVVPATVGKPARLLMNMHGTFFDFPATFSAKNTSGLKPLSNYLKITGDFAPHNGKIVVACDDVSLLENPLAGQSQSNLWFTDWDGLSKLGPRTGYGGPWLNDDVKKGEASDPFLVAGYDQHVLHLSHDSDQPVTFSIGSLAAKGAVDVTVPPKGYVAHVLAANSKVEWMRVRADRDCKATAYFHLTQTAERPAAKGLFDSLANVSETGPRTAGIVRPRGENLGTLQFVAKSVSADGKLAEPVQYTGNVKAELTATGDSPEDAKALAWALEKGKPKLDYSADEASIMLGSGKTRYRLPKTSAEYETPWPEGTPRGIREVATERRLLNAGGTFYVLPDESSGGIAAIKPVSTHGKRISDFCSWRGMLVLTGTRADAKPDGHYVAAADGKAGVWLGDVDDLWKLGKPVGVGGPWHNTAVQVGKPSDPYLMTGYDQKSVELSHDAKEAVEITLEVDFLHNGAWNTYKTFAVPSGETLSHSFPAGYSAHWIRATANKNCKATATFIYE